MDGIVKRLIRDKNFGFIKGEDNQEYFFHASALQNIKFDELEEGTRVHFEDTDGPKGLRAEDVFAE